MIKDIPYKLILASNSPRRKELLAGLGLEFSVKVIEGIDESWPEGLKGEEIPLFISRKKAAPYKQLIAPDELVITADTIVYVDGQVLGKPMDELDAKRMLRLLSGREHEVITGVTFLTSRREHSFAVTTQVRFCKLSEEEIDHYVYHYIPMDKAGAYGIQEWIGYVGVESIEGSYFNVVGLPVQRLYRELLEFVSTDRDCNGE
ncbi:MAG: septum formation protein Maf [Bacteroidaceae bacterium]|nr:septum formation protein Maf [Bacteroidaceae bacterium]